MAQASLNAGFDALAAAYKQGWVGYRNQLKPIPAAALPVAAAYETSLLVLKAHEDKDNPGAFVASPSMPWGWGELTIDEKNPRSGPYHLVWSRDLYQIATALLAAGDKPAANRALDFLFDHQQLEDGSFPQNTQVDGRPKWKALQMDQVGLPIVLAWQLGRTKPADWRHVRSAADLIVEKGPVTEQERWENQEGYSPATIAAEIAGLVCAADIARRNGDTKRAASYERKADSWAANVQRWTATTNGPYSPAPYYLRLTKDRKPNRGTKYAIGDSGPSKLDQRRVVDVSFLELVRLGVKRFDDPAILNTLQIVDQRLRGGAFWHRFSFDGYGERRNGKPWQLFDDDTRTHARPGVADLRRRARRVRAARRPPGGRAAGGDGGLRQRRRDAPGAGLGRPRSDRTQGLPRSTRGRSRRPRWRGRTRSSCGSRGRPRRALRSSAPRSSPTAIQRRQLQENPRSDSPSDRTSDEVASKDRQALSFLADLAPVRGFPLPPGALTNPRLSEHAFHGPRRRPDRCDPRVRGLQAPELPDQEVQAQQPGSHLAAQVLQVVPASYRAPRDALGRRGLAMATDRPRR